MQDVAKNASAIRYFTAIPRPRSMPILDHEPRLPGDRFVTAQPKESPAAIAKLAIKSCSEQMTARFGTGLQRSGGGRHSCEGIAPARGWLMSAAGAVCERICAAAPTSVSIAGPGLMEQQMASSPRGRGNTAVNSPGCLGGPNAAEARRDMRLGDSHTHALTPDFELPVEDAKRIWRTG